MTKLESKILNAIQTANQDLRRIKENELKESKKRDKEYLKNHDREYAEKLELCKQLVYETNFIPHIIYNHIVVDELNFPYTEIYQSTIQEFTGKPTVYDLSVLAAVLKKVKNLRAHFGHRTNGAFSYIEYVEISWDKYVEINKNAKVF